MDPREPAADLLGHVLAVAAVVRETPDAVSIGFRVPPELRAAFAATPGQFLTLAVPSERTGRVARCYSISSATGDDLLTVTVKRTAGGYASGWLTGRVAVGDRLRVLPPSGSFTPRSAEADLLLCAAGSGITPVMSILRAVLGSVTGRVALFYANRDRESVIFADELARLQDVAGERLVVEHWLEEERGRPTADGFAAWAAEHREREVYLCGPGPFMAVVRDGIAAAGFDTHRVRTEEYRSLTGDPFLPVAAISRESLSDAARLEVTLDGRTHALAWPGTHTLVDALAAHGIRAPSACREGKCGACTCELLEGTVDRGRTDALEEEDLAAGYLLGCQARPTSATVRVEF